MTEEEAESTVQMIKDTIFKAQKKRERERIENMDSPIKQFFDPKIVSTAEKIGLEKNKFILEMKQYAEETKRKFDYNSMTETFFIMKIAQILNDIDDK